MSRLNSFLLSILVIFSALIFAQAQQEPVVADKPESIKQLEASLMATATQALDQKGRLRIERAEYYYRTALDYHNARWHSEAQEMARRGLNLIKLQNSRAITANLKTELSVTS